MVVSGRPPRGKPAIVLAAVWWGNPARPTDHDLSWVLQGLTGENLVL